jgi:hypothetical protein
VASPASGRIMTRRATKSAVITASALLIALVLYLVLFRGEIYVRNGYGSALNVVEVRFNSSNVMEVPGWSLAAEHGAAFNTLPAPIVGRRLEFVLAPNPSPGITWSCQLEGPIRPWCYYEGFFTRDGLVCDPCEKPPS